MAFLQHLIQPLAVLLFIGMLICFVGYGYPGYQGRSASGFVWLLWLIAGVMAVVAWVVLVFGP